MVALKQGLPLIQNDQGVAVTFESEWLKAAVDRAAVSGRPGSGLTVAGQVEPGQPQGRGPHRPFADPADHVTAGPVQQHRRLGHIVADGPTIPTPLSALNRHS